MKEKRYGTIIVLIVILLLQGGTVSATQKPMNLAELALYKGADRQQILEEGARKEGKLTFYTSGTIKQAVGPLVNAFKKKYPFIDVVIWRAGSRNLIARLTEEYRAGKSGCDVIEGTQMAYLMFRKVKLLQPYYSPNLAEIEESAIVKAPTEGFYSAAFRLAGVSIGYNTNKVSHAELPNTYEDLLDPKWKGKVAIAGSSTGVNWAGVIKDSHGENILERIAQRGFDVHMVSGRAILDMIIAGEYALSPTIYDSHVINSQRKGAKMIGWKPLEPVYVAVGSIGLHKHTSHPHAALLFIDFELTKRSAEILKSAGYGNFRKDVTGPMKPYKKHLGAASLDDIKKWNGIFNKLFLKK